MNFEIESIDISSFNTSNVSDASKMFYLCKNLKTIYVNTGVIFNTDANTEKMFNGCSRVVGGNGTKYNFSSESYEIDNVDGHYAVIDTAVYDENGNLLSGTPGFFTLVSSN